MQRCKDVKLFVKKVVVLKNLEVNKTNNEMCSHDFCNSPIRNRFIYIYCIHIYVLLIYFKQLY